MANRELFVTRRGLPATDTVNAAGGNAYAFGPRHALAQMAATGCFNDTYYESAAGQLEVVLNLCGEVDPEFVAKTAIYARQRGAMKDMPAFLCAVLSWMSPDLFEKVFPRVVDNGKMLRNFVQMIRSGAAGRKSLGTRPKRMIQRWFADRGDDEVFYAAVGGNPSFADIIRLAHPKPGTPSRAALFKWLLGTGTDMGSLPPKIREYVAWKERRNVPGFDADDDPGVLPDAPFLLLKGCSLSRKELEQLVPRLSWTALRMNIASLARSGVFRNPGIAALAARRLADREEIARARAFPYQAFQTAMALCGREDMRPVELAQMIKDAVNAVYGGEEDAPAVPHIIKRAALEALEITLDNTPMFEDKKTYILIDVSGSMGSPVTGRRRGATTATMCVDAAALLAVAIRKKNPGSVIVPFDHRVREFRDDGSGGVFGSARKLAAMCGGGTDTSAPLIHLNRQRARGDLILYISDNESWIDAVSRGRCSATVAAWEEFKRRNFGAKMVCVDLQPYRDTQAPDADDVMNIGGFSDAVFERIDAFVRGGGPAHWVDAIEAITV